MIASLRGMKAAGRAALPLWLILGLAACGTPTTNAASSPFVLTTRGDEVEVNPPPGVEVTLGAKRVRRAAEPAALDQHQAPKIRAPGVTRELDPSTRWTRGSSPRVTKREWPARW